MSKMMDFLRKPGLAESGSFPYKLILTAIVLTIAFCGGITWHIWNSYLELKENLPLYLRIQEMKEIIMRLDEVLTMSARMGAVTADPRWEERYRQFEPQLDAVIKEVRRLVPDDDKSGAIAQTDAANLALVEMEYRAFEFTRQGQYDEAITLLLGKEYEKQKKLYSEGVERVTVRLQKQVDAFQQTQRQGAFRVTLIIAGALIFLILVWLMVLRMVYHHMAGRRQAEEALARVNQELVRKNEENKMFIYSVSHDLRSPLVNLQGFSQELSLACAELGSLVTESKLPEAAQQRVFKILDENMGGAIHYIQTGVTRLSQIIDSLLRLSRAGRVEYHFQEVAVEKIVSRVVESLSRSALEKGAMIKLHPLPPAWGDPMAIEQIFSNLISNAVNYLNPKRPGLIEVGCLAGSVGAIHELPLLGTMFHTYYVKDNGLGIASQAMNKLFKPFCRLHPDVARGEGIGLAIVQQAVERHGGRIWVESTEGESSTFFATLPGSSARSEVTSERLAWPARTRGVEASEDS